MRRPFGRLLILVISITENLALAFVVVSEADVARLGYGLIKTAGVGRRFHRSAEIQRALECRIGRCASCYRRIPEFAPPCPCWSRHRKNIRIDSQRSARSVWREARGKAANKSNQESAAIAAVRNISGVAMNDGMQYAF